MRIADSVRDLFRSAPEELYWRRNFGVSSKAANKIVKFIKEVDSWRSYWPAADVNRTRYDWASSVSNSYTATKTDYRRIVSRAKLAIDTDPIAIAATETLESQIIGNGIRVIPVPKDENGNYLPDLAKKLSALWDRFNDEFLRNRKEPFYETQARYIRNLCYTGGMILNRVPNKPGSLFNFAYQLVDQAQLDFNYDTSKFTGSLNPTSIDIDSAKDGRRVLHGILFNEYDEPIAYKFEDTDRWIGSANIIHSFRQVHINQYMGIPAFAPILTTLYDVQDLISDTMVKSKIMAAIAFWVSSKDKKKFKSALNSDSTLSIEPGKILSSEVEPKVLQATDSISENLEPMVRLYLRIAAVGFGISYIELMGDLTGANFASSRTVVHDNRRRYQRRQRGVNWQINKPVYRGFVKDCFSHGYIDGKGLSDFNKNSWGLCEGKWIPEPWPWFDPVTDIEALIRQKDAGWLTDEDYFTERGKQRDAVYATLSEEKKLRKSMDIEMDSDKKMQAKLQDPKEKNSSEESDDGQE